MQIIKIETVPYFWFISAKTGKSDVLLCNKHYCFQQVVMVTKSILYSSQKILGTYLLQEYKIENFGFSFFSSTVCQKIDKSDIVVQCSNLLAAPLKINAWLLLGSLDPIILQNCHCLFKYNKIYFKKWDIKNLCLNMFSGLK